MKFLRLTRHGQHWVLDVQFGEDANRARIDASATNLALVRRMAMNAIRQNGPSRTASAAASSALRSMTITGPNWFSGTLRHSAIALGIAGHSHNLERCMTPKMSLVKDRDWIKTMGLDIRFA